MASSVLSDGSSKGATVVPDQGRRKTHPGTARDDAHFVALEVVS
ncbi:MAG: hypothetical protein ACOC1F_10800 [Myxococcota bacterium]